MVVGAQTSQGNVNQTLTQLAIRWRDLADVTMQQSDFLNALDAGGLEALGFSSQDASTVLYFINNMATCAKVYLGNATQTPAVNYEEILTPLWAGQ